MDAKTGADIDGDSVRLASASLASIVVEARDAEDEAIAACYQDEPVDGREFSAPSPSRRDAGALCGYPCRRGP